MSTRLMITPFVVPLAMRKDQTTTGTTGAWVNAPDAIVAQLNGDAFAGQTLRVRVWIKAANGTVTARLYNITDAAAAGTGAAVTSTSYVEAVFFVTLATGKHDYRLELSPSVTDAEIAGLGVLESAQ
jgi:hypothetical protein